MLDRAGERVHHLARPAIAHRARAAPRLDDLETRRVTHASVRLDRNGNLFDRIRLRVAPWTCDLYCRFGVAAGFDPGVVATRRRPGHLDLELGGHAPRLLPVASRDPDQAGVVGVVRERLLVRAQLLQQAPDVVRDERLVDDATECRE